VRGIRTSTPLCPRVGCRQEHIAGVEGSGDRWFTCGPHRFEIPDGDQGRLGTDLWAKVWRIPRPTSSGCLNCPALVDTTDPDGDGVRRYVCYRCGTVGGYRQLARPEWEPERETWLFAEAGDEIAAARLAIEEPDVPPPPATSPAPTVPPPTLDDEGSTSRVGRTWDRFLRYMEGGT